MVFFLFRINYFCYTKNPLFTCYPFFTAPGGGAGGVKVEAQEEEEERRNVAIDVGGKNINMALNELAMINRHAAFTSLLLTSYLSAAVFRIRIN
jgi:hypothetical protein